MYDLKPHQITGRDWLATRKRALLADDMRVGKTGQVTDAIVRLRLKRILVVCPALVRGVWRQAFAERIKPFYSPARIEIISYDEARNNTERYLTGPRWDVLVVDECHFTKNPNAGRTKAVFAKGRIAWHADRTWALSGTPAVNNAAELWLLTRVFGYTRMTYDDWLHRYCNVDDTGKPKGTRTDRAPELRGVLDQFMLRRMKKDMDMEPLTTEPWPIEADYDFVDMTHPVPAEKRRLLRQAADERKLLEMALDDEAPGQYLLDHSTSYAAVRRLNALLKAPAVYNTLKFELENDLIDKVVIFGYHRDALNALYRMFKYSGIRAELVYGGTPEKKAKVSQDRFARPTARKGSRVFVGQIVACGAGIDLSAAHEGVMLEKDWVPWNNRQAMDRMTGYGQTHPVTVREAVLENSIDAHINRVVDRKAAELATIFE